MDTGHMDNRLQTVGRWKDIDLGNLVELPQLLYSILIIDGPQLLHRNSHLPDMLLYITGNTEGWISLEWNLPFLMHGQTAYHCWCNILRLEVAQMSIVHIWNSITLTDIKCLISWQRIWYEFATCGQCQSSCLLSLWPNWWMHASCVQLELCHYWPGICAI